MLARLVLSGNKPLKQDPQELEFSAKILTGEFQIKTKRFTETQIIKILKEAEGIVPLISSVTVQSPCH
ncbi:MAG: hypothetical protein ACI9EW_001481 [Cellvibrionaceae bacterium]|jgi:hypothetical protein